MIGKVMVGKSFRGCLLYCLHDKVQKGLEQAMKDRAEVLLYNRCYGTAKELMHQFGEVRLLNRKVEKPVLHITLSMAPGEQLSKDKLMTVAEGCARDMGFEGNQYIAVLHRDTHHQHLHLVANRIGFDGRTVPDSNSYKKIALFCRKAEREYGLQQVQSPRRFQSHEERQMPRQDQRKEQLREHIKRSLADARTYPEFEVKMKALGYQISKGRGISFLDSKGVKTKGSEVGYPLMRIQGTLAQKQTIPHRTDFVKSVRSDSEHRSSVESDNSMEQALSPKAFTGKLHDTTTSRTLEVLLTPEPGLETISQALLKKKRKRQKRSL